MYGIWKNPVAIASCVILVAHEFGHWYAAKDAGADASFPLFIPLGFIAVGATRIKDLNQDGDVVAAAGPIAGTIVGIIICGVLYFFYPQLATWSLVALVLYEVINGLVGSDGKRYRQFRRAV